ncbi:MAG: family rane protein [Clostridia bacterium]|jgi:putative membrane protein (TIGR04086 family)|nr:family rane protein [Clostridia bacterium]
MKTRKVNWSNKYSTATQDEGVKSNTYMVMLKSLLVCLIISFVMILLYALILSFTSISDATMSKVTQTILIISIAIASAYGGKKTRHRGWLFGAILGLIFTILLVPFGMALGQVFTMDIYLIAKLLVAAVVGAIGGIIGVNLN